MQRIPTYMLLLSALLSLSFGCSCFESNFREDFCASNTTVVATIVAEMDTCEGGTCDPATAFETDEARIYVLRVHKTLRGEAPEDNVMFVREPIRHPSRSCGSVTLPVSNTKYLLNFPPKLMNSTMCPMTTYEFGNCNKLWKYSDLTPGQLNYVANKKCPEILRAW